MLTIGPLSKCFLTYYYIVEWMSICLPFLKQVPHFWMFTQNFSIYLESTVKIAQEEKPVYKNEESSLPYSSRLGLKSKKLWLPL